MRARFRSAGASRTAAAVALAAMLPSACGGADDPRPGLQERAVAGTIQLPRPQGGPPDAGTARGHGNEAVLGTTSTAAFSFTGTVDPPESEVSISSGTVRVEPSGRFTVAVASPRSGSKELSVEATASGHRPWRAEVSVVRAAPASVEVPERDTTAPTAALLFEPGAGADRRVLASPSRAGDPPDFVRLARPSFRATGTVRDATGGTGRIRLSVTTTTRCAATVKQAVRQLPPAQIVDIALPPGASAPVERERSARFDLPVPPGCSVRGEVLAEGTDAAGRQAVTHHAGFVYP